MKVVPILSALALVAGCDSGLNQTSPVTATFTVTVENVSKPNLLNTQRAMGTVPLSPGAYAVFTGSDPAFTPGQSADVGTERIAEDGFPMPPLGSKTTMLTAASNVRSSGAFQSPGGQASTPGIGAGEKTTFTITASPGDRLQIQTMFVQSDDWFYAFGNGGLNLFNGNTAVSGDMTSGLVLYDAGTEQDTPPGTGPYQKPVQDPMATNIGPSENVAIQLAAQRHPDYTIPATSSVIRITVTPQP